MAVVGSGNCKSMTEGARPLVHKVTVPAKLSFVKEVGRVVRETFFHDVATLEWAEGVTRRRQALLALKYAFPIVDWLSTYSQKLFLQDLLAGLTIASLAIPQVSYSPWSLHYGQLL